MSHNSSKKDLSSIIKTSIINFLKYGIGNNYFIIENIKDYSKELKLEFFNLLNDGIKDKILLFDINYEKYDKIKEIRLIDDKLSYIYINKDPKTNEDKIMTTKYSLDVFLSSILIMPNNCKKTKTAALFRIYLLPRYDFDSTKFTNYNLNLKPIEYFIIKFKLSMGLINQETSERLLKDLHPRLIASTIATKSLIPKISSANPVALVQRKKRTPSNIILSHERYYRSVQNPLSKEAKELDKKIKLKLDINKIFNIAKEKDNYEDIINTNIDNIKRISKNIYNDNDLKYIKNEVIIKIIRENEAKTAMPPPSKKQRKEGGSKKIKRKVYLDNKGNKYIKFNKNLIIYLK